MGDFKLATWTGSLSGFIVNKISLSNRPVPNFNTTMKSPTVDSPMFTRGLNSVSSTGKRTIHKDTKSPEKRLEKFKRKDLIQSTKFKALKRQRQESDASK